MVIYMDQYRKAKSNMADAHRHVAQKLCVNGIAASDVIALPQSINDLSPQFPEDFSHVDMAHFYNRVCALATQI